MSETFTVCEACQKLNRVQLGTGKEPICGSCQSALPIHNAVVDASDKNFQALIHKSPLPVVLDIWAPWCGPCRSFAPTFEEASQAFAGKVIFVKLNSDENQQTSRFLGVRGIPTLMVFKNGKEVARQSGALPREIFNQWLSQNI